MPAHTVIWKPIALKLLSGLLFVVMGALIKHLSARYPIGQLVFARCIAALPLLLAWSWWLGTLRRDLQARRPWLHIGRSLIGFGSMGLSFLAYANLPVVEAQAIMFLTPLAVLLLASVFSGEHTAPSTWLASGLGLVGVALMLGAVPMIAVATTEQRGVLYGTLSVLFAAAATLLIRHMTRIDTPHAITISFTVLGALLSLTSLPFGWTSLSFWDALLLGLLGVLGAIAHLSFVGALAKASPAFLSPLEYVGLLWAVVIGAAIFGEWPTPWEWVGAAIIVAASLFGTLAPKHRPRP